VSEQKKIIIRVPAELQKKLKFKALLENRSYNSLVVELLEEYLKDTKVPKK